MFIGHFAVGFASKKAAPRASLGVLMLAPQLLDALWPIFIVAGLESVRIDPGNTKFTPLDLHDYPYSHSLVTALGWSVLAAVLYLVARRDRVAALVIGGAVFSHWILDWITHRPDMPLYPGSATNVGLGLWNSVPGTLAVELSMWIGAVVIYLRATRPKNRAGSIGLWALIGLLSVLYLVSAFGPPPPSANAMVAVAFVGYLFIPWAWWVDRNRELR